MNPWQKTLVQGTWAQVVPIADQAAALFYGRLFELDPKLRAMFHGDIAEQGKKLMTMLNLAVAGLDDVEKLTPALRALGARHVDYGVADEHYDTVGAALLWTLEKGLGPEFTPEVKEAWAAVYGVLAGEMKAAAGKAAIAV